MSSSSTNFTNNSIHKTGFKSPFNRPKTNKNTVVDLTIYDEGKIKQREELLKERIAVKNEIAKLGSASPIKIDRFKRKMEENKSEIVDGIEEISFNSPKKIKTFNSDLVQNLLNTSNLSPQWQDKPTYQPTLHQHDVTTFQGMFNAPDQLDLDDLFQQK
jgi:hypothetical protein